jgi:hypothetical protein
VVTEADPELSVVAGTLEHGEPDDGIEGRAAPRALGSEPGNRDDRGLAQHGPWGLFDGALRGISSGPGHLFVLSDLVMLRGVVLRGFRFGVRRRRRRRGGFGFGLRRRRRRRIGCLNDSAQTEHGGQHEDKFRHILC